MNTLLVPLDASNCADNALLFAILLAQKQAARLLLVNAYEPGVAEQKHSELLLRAQETKLRHAGLSRYECLSLPGRPLEVLLRVAEQQQPTYIVMGTHGEGLATSIFGSTAWHVMEQAPCPVLAIPEDVRFQHPIQNITYATDYRSSDLQAIVAVAQLAALWQADLTLLHIDSPQLGIEDEIHLLNRFRQKLIGRLDEKKLRYHLLNGEDVASRIESYIADHNPDMLVMATHRRSFFERLFQKSVTRQLAVGGYLPLLVFHYNSRSAVTLF